MNYPCELIQDLLPLYHDGVCSVESRRAVEHHIKDCPPCRNMLRDLDELPEASKAAEEAAPLAPIQKKWLRERKKALWKGLGVALALLLLLVGKYVLTEWHCIPIEKEDIILQSVYETSDGRIHIYFRSVYDNRHVASSCAVLGDDGNGYIEIYRTILAKRDAEPSISGAGFSFTPQEGNALTQWPDFLYAPKIYLGVKNEPDKSILVWEEGMEIRPATDEEEARENRWTLTAE